ncbi:hypothetical protein [Pseudotamlana agarivorans]|uniref:hypothetical protein n=1 Tax=Pseudotamlana agarivorans TaxID=481183 RepID=UPI000833D11A|nr:hypothetical protein [Tamlana agarivorans]
MKKFYPLLFISFLAYNIKAQTIALSDTYISHNQNYINATSLVHISKHIKTLENQLLAYNHKSELADLYDDENDLYTVSFYRTFGKIEAVYNKNGKIIKTFEKYKNKRLPLEVMQAISKRFPNWSIIEGVQYIKYDHEQDSLNQVFKVKIKKEEDILSLKTNEIGQFL